MGCCLTSWFSKKQTALAISTTEAEYVSAGKACQQALWMKQAFIDYDVRLDDVPIMCDNKGVIDLSKNPVQHSRTKHIEIRHHFLRDNVQKGHISIEKVTSVDNIADIVTKPLKLRVPFRVMTTSIFHPRFNLAFTWQNEWSGSLSKLGYFYPMSENQEGIVAREEVVIPLRRLPPFDQPYSSHLNDDDVDDVGMRKGTCVQSTPSPIRYVNSLTNQVPQVFQNLPNIDPYLEPFYTRQTKIINHKVQVQDELRG
ncbi:hypothetical protein Tco_0827237 [Tanacetum coccineum]